MPSEEAIAVARKVSEWARRDGLVDGKAIEEIATIIDEALGNVWDAAIDVARQSAKRSKAAGLTISTVELAIMRLEAAKARALSDQPTIVEFEAPALKSERTD